jgi:hypothetical protein
MAITPSDYFDTLDVLAELMPFLCRPSAPALELIWATLPAEVANELTVQHLLYAAAQFLQDPRRPTELPTHLALLRYLYRLENGLPNFAWGLRQDLSERMARPGFHPLPASQADLAAQHGLAKLDGPRHAPEGVLAQLQVFPSLHSQSEPPADEPVP